MTVLSNSYAEDSVVWINSSQADADVVGTFLWNYVRMQAQYYDMPRKYVRRASASRGGI